MLKMLMAYDGDGNIVATLDYVTAKDEDGNVIGLVDFEAHEDNGHKLRDIWVVSGAVGSGTWPEWLGSAAHGFKAEVDPRSKKIMGLVHRESGLRRDRSEIETRIQQRIEAAKGKPADIRDIVGGPDRPLLLDDKGRTKARPKGKPTSLPVIRRKIMK